MDNFKSIIAVKHPSFFLIRLSPTSTMKPSTLFLIFLLISSTQLHRNFKCKSFDQKSIIVDHCNVQKVQRDFVYNMALKVLKNLTKPVYLRCVIGRKTNQNYFQDYFRSEMIEYCGAMDGGLTNPFFKGFIDAFVKAAPELIHPCPYLVGPLNSSFSIDHAKVFNLGISGTYKVELTFYNKKKMPLASVRSDQKI